MKKESDGILFMAIDRETLIDTFSDELRELLTKDFEVRLLVFDKDKGANRGMATLDDYRNTSKK